jgi:hypothetical protein
MNSEKKMVDRAPESKLDLTRPKLRAYIISNHKGDFVLFDLEDRGGEVVYVGSYVALSSREQTRQENGLKVLHLLKEAFPDPKKELDAALEEAVCEQIMEIVQCDEGADLTAREPQFLDTAFTYMCYMGLSKCVSHLLIYVSNLAVEDRFNETALEVAIHYNTKRNQKPRAQAICKAICKANGNQYMNSEKKMVDRAPESKLDLTRPKLKAYIISNHKGDFALFDLEDRGGQVVYVPQE